MNDINTIITEYGDMLFRICLVELKKKEDAASRRSWRF